MVSKYQERKNLKAEIATLKRKVRSIFEKNKINFGLVERKKIDFKISSARSRDQLRNILSHILDNIPITLTKMYVSADIVFHISGEEDEERTVNVNQYFGTNEKGFSGVIYYFYEPEIEQYIRIACDNYVDDVEYKSGEKIDRKYEIVDRHIQVVQGKTKTVMESEINNIKMRSPKTFSLKHFFGELVDVDKKLDDNCVKAYIKSIIPKNKMSHKTIDEFFKDCVNGITNNDIYKFCVKYNIKLMVYDFEGRLIKTNDKYISEKHNYSGIYFINFDNHCTPIKNPKLKMLKEGDILYENMLYDPNFHENLKNKLSDKIVIPSLLSLTKAKNGDRKKKKNKEEKGLRISKYFDNSNSKLITCNEDLDKSFNLLKYFGLEETINSELSRNNMFNHLLRYSQVASTKSFWPDAKFHKHNAVNYKSNLSIKKSDVVYTVDKNKQYGYSFMKLKKLLTIDIRKFQIKKYEKNEKVEVKDNHIYIIDYDLNKLNIRQKVLVNGHLTFTGNFIKKIQKENIQFTFIESYECDVIHNPYSDIIEKLYSYSEKNKDSERYIKDTVNLFIGQLEKNSNTNTSYVYKKMYNSEEYMAMKSEIQHKIVQLGEYFFEFEVIDKLNIYNNILTNIQIKCESRIMLYDKMVELNIDETNLLQINVDSISFINNNKIIINDIDENDFTKWKIIKMRNENFSNIFTKSMYVSLEECNIIYDNSRNHICNAPAGSGKTHMIQNDLLVQIKKLNKSYIVLCPTHQTTRPYKIKTDKCDVYQKYTLNDIKLDDYDIIIIDEFGLCGKDLHDLIIKTKMECNGKYIYAFGDFSQLLPVGSKSPFNNPSYLNNFFGHKHDLDRNMRNRFSKENYEYLKNCEDKDDLISKVNNYGKDKYQDAETILCWFNETRKIYNNLMLKHLGFESKYKVGVKLMCITNNFIKKYNVSNKMCFRIKAIRNGEFKLVDIEDNTFIVDIPKEDLDDKYFVCAYAKTAYSIQGDSIKSYYWCNEDDKCMDGRLAYTIISRLKEDFNIVMKHNNDMGLKTDFTFNWNIQNIDESIQLQNENIIQAKQFLLDIDFGIEDDNTLSFD